MFGRKNKIFCISMQRTGTTSVGEFFHQLGYSVATFGVSYNNQWTWKWYQGDFESIFKSNDFRKNQVFEDDPWWCPEFYKYLFHRFPKSKFILFTRDSNDWYQSMLNHSGGKNPGNTLLHCKIYRREVDFEKYLLLHKDIEINKYEIDNLLDLKNKLHYTNIYEQYNKEVKRFFNQNDNSRLFVGELEDPSKWEKLATYVGLSIPPNFNIHENKSNPH